MANNDVSRNAMSRANLGGGAAAIVDKGGGLCRLCLDYGQVKVEYSLGLWLGSPCRFRHTLTALPRERRRHFLFHVTGGPSLHRLREDFDALKIGDRFCNGVPFDTLFPQSADNGFPTGEVAPAAILLWPLTIAAHKKELLWCCSWAGKMRAFNTSQQEMVELLPKKELIKRAPYFSCECAAKIKRTAFTP